MAFRDETEALRAHIGALEVELDDARDRVEELEVGHAEVETLRARVKELEEELGKHTKQKKPWKVPQWAKPVGITALVGVVAVVVFLSEQFPLSADLEAEPSRGVIDLGDNSFPPAITAQVEGDHAVDDISTGCQGYIPSQPLVVVHTDKPRTVHIWTESSSDLVLFVRAENGQVFCDDDSGDRMNPMLVADLPAGDHRVWVGTYSADEPGRFDLRVDGRDTDGSGLSMAPPSIEALTVRGVSHFVTAGAARGAISAARARPGCIGSVPIGPQVTLDLEEPGQISMIARASEDLVLLVRRPDGSFLCDDDGAGNLDPMLAFEASPGRHAVWVGTYTSGTSSSFELTTDVRPSAPDADARARLGRWDLDAEALLSFSDRVDGRTPVSSTHPECRTLYGSAPPDLELTLEHERTVTLSLNSDSWLGLLVEHPDGTQSCDPSLDNSPHRWSVGMHRVWIAAPEPGAGTRFTLVAQTQD